ncbi:4Fe-4S single cluster domain-containing protein [Allochromatium vinosum]|uniref:4Fe-4S single cluster domain-containing protein n=1 Tax=Allochromatium vinosum TaxID=1049 RepID=UPI00190490D8|nr:4Fe-4S single cluster domain-containing protein [Allochromatium vinosum]
MTDSAGPCLNLAERCRRTRALGPGLRYVLWVQGCPFDCPGCLADLWRARRRNRLIAVESLARDILDTPEVEGLTLSGGEPMLQARACRRLIEQVRARRPDFTLVLYTGFTLEELQRSGHGERLALLDQVDVLIDGRYQAEHNDNRGLRGSSNQRVHLLTDAYRQSGTAYFTDPARRVELHPRPEDLLMVGIPPLGLDPALREILPR